MKKKKLILTVSLIGLAYIASCILIYSLIKDDIVPSNNIQNDASKGISSNRITPTFEKSNTETNRTTVAPSISINPTFDLGEPEPVPTPGYDVYPNSVLGYGESITLEVPQDSSTDEIEYGYDPDTNILTVSKNQKKIRSWAVEYADQIWTMGLTNSDDLLLWGSIRPDEGAETSVLLKYSVKGELLWAKRFGDFDMLARIIPLKNGFIIQEEHLNGRHPDHSVYCDDNGDPIMQWVNKDFTIEYLVMSDGSFIFTETRSEDGYASISKYNNQGKRLWVNKCPIKPNEIISEIVEYKNGFQVVASIDYNGDDVSSVISFDSNGNVVNVESKKQDE